MWISLIPDGGKSGSLQGIIWVLIIIWRIVLQRLCKRQLEEMKTLLAQPCLSLMMSPPHTILVSKLYYSKQLQKNPSSKTTCHSFCLIPKEIMIKWVILLKVMKIYSVFIKLYQFSCWVHAEWEFYGLLISKYLVHKSMVIVVMKSSKRERVVSIQV